MRFRLGATRWRGLRLQFASHWREIYGGSGLLWVLALLWGGLSWSLYFGFGSQPFSVPGLLADKPAIARFTVMIAWLLGAALTLLCLCRLDYNRLDLLLRKTRVGAEPVRHKRPVLPNVMETWLVTVMLCMLGLSLGFVVWKCLPGGYFDKPPFFGVGRSRNGSASVMSVLYRVVIVLLPLLLLSAPARAYREARMFQLVWNDIGVNQAAHFKCRLSSDRFVLLRIQNLLLTLLTLGFYRPLARLSEYRMKLASVTLHVTGDLDQVAGAMLRQQTDLGAVPDFSGRRALRHYWQRAQWLAPLRRLVHKLGPESPIPEGGKLPPLAFIGSAGAYFPVWLVNVLLCCVTLGLYAPWARRRTARYFYRHTLVAGRPLEFTGRPRPMLLIFVLLLLLAYGAMASVSTLIYLIYERGELAFYGMAEGATFSAYDITGTFGQNLAVASFVLAGAALAPFFWGHAVRFRLGATVWRGLHLQFAAGWREAYRASRPLRVMALLWTGLFLYMRALVPGLADSFLTWRALVLPALVLTLLCSIRLDYDSKSLLARNVWLGAGQVRWTPVYRDFVNVWLATLVLFILCMPGFVALNAVLTDGIFDLLARLPVRMPPRTGLTWFVLLDWFQETRSRAWFVFTMALFGLSHFLLLMLVSAPARAYREARMFQLLWNGIGIGQAAHFKCRLSSIGFVLARVGNLLLTLLTLGLYRPLARVSEYRMKLESVTLYVKGGAGQVAGAPDDARAGDAAGRDSIGHAAPRDPAHDPGLAAGAQASGAPEPAPILVPGPVPGAMPRDGYTHPLAFTGGTGAYFRVWIVNLLLCCVTLGLYTPWARQRTAQYFYRHTLVAGSPLEFTGRPRGQVLGFVLLLLLWLLLMLALASGILWSAWLHQMLRWIPIFDLRIKGDELPWLFRAAEWIPTFGIFASIGHKSMAVPVLAGAALLRDALSP
ncbi:DUF898 domain-containing protein, partial [Verminephrobacter sp. Larva24]